MKNKHSSTENGNTPTLLIFFFHVKVWTVCPSIAFEHSTPGISVDLWMTEHVLTVDDLSGRDGVGRPTIDWVDTRHS